MPLKINKTAAASILREESRRATSSQPNDDWMRKVEHLSQLCSEGASKTHIAFLGTAMLAKAVDLRADLFAIKPDHANGNPNAFSARTLSESVLVPLAAELGINIGVTGRQPLNNQPYFRMTRLDDGTPVHSGGRLAFDYMVRLVRDLQAITDSTEARNALRAFVAVRMRYQPRYADGAAGDAVSPAALVTAIEQFVRENSEGGRRAQAAVAGLLDVFAGTERVESGRINDPSRKYPGDVCVRSAADPNIWDKAIEVRDKPVSMSDVQIFGKKCVDMGVREAAVVMVSEKQQPLERSAVASWANGFGLGVTLFHGWKVFVDQALFWSELPQVIGATKGATFIRDRLIGVEASPEGVSRWDQLMRSPRE